MSFPTTVGRGAVAAMQGSDVNEDSRDGPAVRSTRPATGLMKPQTPIPRDTVWNGLAHLPIHPVTRLGPTRTSMNDVGAAPSRWNPQDTCNTKMEDRSCQAGDGQN